MNQTTNSGNRLRGLMALLSDQQRGAGPCPDAEKLARLIDNRVSPEERQELMEHLSCCDSCYQTWLLACSPQQGSEQGAGNTRRIQQVLGYGGTAFAAVVSVVLYFNIHNFNGPLSMSSPPPPTTADEPVEAVLPPLEAAKKQEASRQLFSAEAEADNVQLHAVPQLQVAPPRPQRSSSKSVPAMVGMEKQSRMSTPDPLASFYQSVLGACSAALLEEQPWDALYKQGTRSLKQISEPNRKARAEQIVQALQQMVDSGELAPGCQRIRDLIPEAEFTF